MCAFLVSPGVSVKELDLSSIIPAVSTSIGATAGYFRWGPMEKIKLLSSESDLIKVFGEPDALTAESFFTATSFLKYGSALKTVRANDDSGVGGKYANAQSDENGLSDVLDDNTGAITFTTTSVAVADSISGLVTTDDAYNGKFITIGDDTVEITDSDATGTAGFVVFTLGTALSSVPADGAAFAIKDASVVIKNEEQFEYLTLLQSAIYARYAGALGNSLQVEIIGPSNWATSNNSDEFDAAPTGDEVHLIIIDEDGEFAGTAGTIVEKWAFLQTTDGALKDDGSNNYYKDVINENSDWIYFNEDASVSAGSYSLVYGSDTDATEMAEAGNITAALDIFNDSENVDISLIFSSVTDPDGSNVIMNKAHEIAYSRKDCVAFLSPPIADSTGNDPLTDVLDWGSGITVRDADGSYAVGSTTAVYVYDKYRDKFLWIGDQGIIAGLCANTDDVAEPWFSPAGFNRGSIKGVVKAAFLPKQAERDSLYKFGLNFLLNQSGTGLVLFGDKTLQAKPSAFDRINVRRLFIVLEKAIATAAKFQLFELNDEFTRVNFRNMVEPFLRDVKGRRGMYDFYVHCDERNNTPQVIDGNRFVADIYIAPAKSINFINLTFVATRTGVNFEEIIGRS